MPSIRSAAFGLLSSLALSLPAVSVPALGQTAYVSNNPPYSIQSGPHPGFGVELVNEMAKLLKTKVNYEFMAWGEAQAKVKAGHDLLIFPFARTPEREPNYTWMQKLFDNNVLFVSKSGASPIDSVEQAKALASIGVLDGSPWDKELEKRGLTNVKRYPTSLALVSAVVSGEVAAGYGPDLELKYAWRVGENPGEPVFGKQIQKVDQFLAESKDSPSIKQEDWQAAFGTIQQDGTFDRIYASYFGSK
jgi:polar amino acid transport system substrate-binding protein